MADNTITVELELDANGVVTGVRQADGALVKLSRTQDRTADRSENLTRKLKQLGLAAAAMVGLREGARVVTDYEQGLADLSAITGIAGRDLDRLGDTARQNALETGQSAGDQVEAYKLLASNISLTTEQLEVMGREVVTLSVAAGVDLATAANAVANVINQFGLAASESGRVVNVLAAGAKEGAAEVDDLAAAMKEAGVAARSANVSVESTVGALEILAQNGVKGAEAGTSLRNVLTILRSEAGKLADAGIHGLNVEGEGLVRTLVRLEPLIGNATALTKIFGRENINAAEVLIRNAKAVDEMTAAVTGTETALEQAGVQADTLQGDLKKLRTALEEVALDGYDGFGEAAREAVQDVTALVRALDENWESVEVGIKVLALAVVAQKSYQASLVLTEAATVAARIATDGFSAAVKRNPIGLIVSALVTGVAAYFAFRTETDKATEAVDDNTRAHRDLTDASDGAAQSTDEATAAMERQSAAAQTLAHDLRTLRGWANTLGDIWGWLGRQAERLMLWLSRLNNQVNLASVNISLFAAKIVTKLLGPLHSAGNGLERFVRWMERLRADSLTNLDRIAERFDEISRAGNRARRSIDWVREGDRLVYRPSSDEPFEARPRLTRDRSGKGEEPPTTPPPPVGGSGSGDAEDAAKTAENARRKALDQEFADREREIEMMREGTDRVVAEIELRFDREREAYRRSFGALSAEVRAQFDALEEAQLESARSIADAEALDGAVDVGGVLARIEREREAGERIEEIYADTYKQAADRANAEISKIQPPPLPVEEWRRQLDEGLATSVDDVDRALRALGAAFEAADSDAARADVQDLIDAYQRLRRAMEDLGEVDLGAMLEAGLEDALGAIATELGAIAAGADRAAREIDEANGRIAELQAQVAEADTEDERAELRAAIEAQREYVAALEETRTASAVILGNLGAVLGDMLIQLGKVAIETAVGIGAIKLALKSFNPLVAAAAGVALIAFGSYIKGKVANAASVSAPRSTSSGVSTPTSETSDTYANVVIDGARADGGPVAAGETYLVGEEGPEIVRFDAPGVVVPAAATRKMLQGGGPQTVRVEAVPAPSTVERYSFETDVGRLDVQLRRHRDTIERLRGS